jgi:hypothetical protein
MSNASGAQAIPASTQMIQILAGKWIAQAIAVAAELKIADLLSGGEKSVQELAKASGSQERSLYRLLRALSSVGVFAEVAERRFGITPLAECLRSDVPGSLRNIARMVGMPTTWRAWQELLHCVKTGETGLKKAFGITDPFDYLAQHPDEAAIFNSAMTDFSGLTAPAIAAAYDFGQFRKIMDVAGGQGVLLMTILQHYPKVHGILFDRPEVLKGAQLAITAAGLTQRCQVLDGNFFEAIPEGADAYMMKAVIHDWDDEKACLILKNCRRHMNSGSKLLLVEMVVSNGNEPSFGKLLDLDQMVLVTGRERTEEEHRELFSRAGFRLTGITPTASPVSIIEGIPV